MKTGGFRDQISTKTHAAISFLKCAFKSFLVHLSQRLKCTIVITSGPSSVHPSVRRPSVVSPSDPPKICLTFSTSPQKIRILTELSPETWQEARAHTVLYKVSIFRADRKNKMAALASEWSCRYFRLRPLKPKTGRISTKLDMLIYKIGNVLNHTIVLISGRSEKQDGRSCFLLAETLSSCLL